MAGDPTPALTGRRRTRPTSLGCRNPWQPKPGRAPLTAAQAAVQTNRATSLHQRLAAITASRTECKAIEREAHALVSLAGNLGLVELSACSRQLVDACRSAAEGDISKHVRELNEAAERALARLEPLLTLGEMSVDLYRY